MKILIFKALKMPYLSAFLKFLKFVVLGREKIFVYNEDKNKAMLATFLIVFYSSFKKHRLYYVRSYGPLQAVFLYFITKKGKTENDLKKENN